MSSLPHQGSSISLARHHQSVSERSQLRTSSLLSAVRLRCTAAPWSTVAVAVAAIISGSDRSTEATFFESLPLFFGFGGLSSSSLDSVTTGGDLQSFTLCFFPHFMHRPAL